MKELKPIADEVEIVEKRVVKRLTFRNYLASIFEAFNLERGGIYTLKRLFINPGKMVRAYISTGRYSFTPPFRLLLVTTTLVILVISYSNMGQQYVNHFTMDPEQAKVLENLKGLENFANLFLWVYIPIGAFFTWLFNRKSGINYTENLVFQTYFFCITNIISLLFALDHLISLAVLLFLASLGTVMYSVYSYREFFQKSTGRAIGESIAIYIIATTVYSIFLLAIVIGILIYKLGVPEVGS